MEHTIVRGHGQRGKEKLEIFFPHQFSPHYQRTIKKSWFRGDERALYGLQVFSDQHTAYDF